MLSADADQVSLTAPAPGFWSLCWTLACAMAGGHALGCHACSLARLLEEDDGSQGSVHADRVDDEDL